ncbi:hypothetical protein K491DRAFT_720384 [Lophiostoma macrostomum CBS 122681]|uniref:Heterokaryon incompatibility domain-containing protein n=1 Tax=Lophiostoma macrostomum CBS 122681 TaxID=1314788 RepID=A0A6A6SW94_9PLEO|nr:hypothetical protein K491DRAFT_720384 [Lophiostoma macrostomum CBS 122681]
MSTIKCEILHASLVNPPQYTAVSYAWGDADEKRKIVLEGATIPVAVSLHGALNAIRDKRDSVLVWIDALCIDQQNRDERTQQVQLMTDIYTKADSVALWLGQEADESHLAVNMLQEVAANARSSGKLTSLIASSYGKPDLGAVVSLFERDYWRRLWVVQEVFNAKDINVYCGSSVLHWSIYTEASHAFWRHKGDIDHYFPRGASQGKSQQVSMNQFTYSQVLGYQGPSSLPDVGSLMGLGEEALLEVMCACRRKLTFDARDKVFGIIGVLSQEIRSEFPVDYNLSVKEVYINVVDYMLSTTERLDIICESIHFPLHTSSVDLPSWVPDWFHIPETTALGRLYAFKASGTTKAAYRFFDERRKLEISAVYIDTITTHGIAVGTLCTVSDYLMAFLHWRALLLGSYEPESDGDDHESQDAFCRTLSLDEVPTGWERSNDWLTACYHVFASLIRERLPRLPLDRELKQYVAEDVGASVQIRSEERRQFLQDHFGSRMMGRCFCITEEGLIGMGSGFMAAGDVVVVPLGCSTPIILRPQGSHGEYRFVGDVYIHTFMHGKAVDHLQAGKRQLEKFVVH